MNLQTSIAAFLCTTAISLLPNLILYTLPKHYSPNSPLLSCGQALAAGALLGDVFLHSLPHALVEEVHHHSQNEHGHIHANDVKVSHEIIETLGFAILFGFVIFLLFDVFVRTFGHDHHHHNHNHHNHHDNHNCHDHCHDHGHGHNHEQKETKKGSEISSAVVLSLIGDSLHNFTDGLAIGASFASSANMPMSGSYIEDVTMLVKSRGGLASLAIFLHEIPHSIGDFAILVSSGISKHKAIMSQFATAIPAYFGAYVGIAGMEQMRQILGVDLMVPFTAGGFIYLSSVTILPPLLEQRESFIVRMMQIISFVIGTVFMYYVGVLEHEGGHSHSLFDQNSTHGKTSEEILDHFTHDHYHEF